MSSGAGARTGWTAVAVLLLALAACTGTDDGEARPTTTGTRSADASSTPSPSASPTPTPVPDPRSLPALFDQRIEGGGLRSTGGAIDRGRFRQVPVRYRSGNLTITGQLFVPDGDGPFPAVILNHGYIEPSVYVSGQGMPREQAALAQAGFVVLHTDYRGHAGSDDTGPLDLESRLGYTRDTIAAVRAVRKLDAVDPDRVAMMGRSMGGGVTLNALVVEPGIVDAAVVYASVSSSFEDNFRRWTVPGRPDRARAVEERWGTADDEPQKWAGLSARTYFDRVEVPVLMHHGTDDESCPYPWATATRNALRRAGADVRLITYRGEHHTFGPRWQASMDRTIDFLRDELR
ncbi:alpha/beta fold hydrolase [Aeromicrobium sp.]|jgi:dipeptidyl aminopeptidase/acylaminoacyl peptidase|uniref:alpha/beta hydrolase family protein n=1 Tax=Aeromicrobium sp. TaxID=1871063 RepID=UPI002622C045|nr:alpha/beta fold hydrolase [Aeromicrobium sp.]